MFASGTGTGIQLRIHGHAVLIHSGVIRQQRRVFSTHLGLKVSLRVLLKAELLPESVHLLLETGSLITLFETNNQSLSNGVQLRTVPLVKLSQIFSDSGAFFGNHEVFKRAEVFELGDGVSAGRKQVHAVLGHDGPEGLLVGDGHGAVLVHGGVGGTFLLFPELGVRVELLSGLELFVLFENEEGAPGLEEDLLAAVVLVFLEAHLVETLHSGGV